MRAYRYQARILKALAHPARLRILNALREEGQYVCHLVALLGRSQPNISQHLAVLRGAGLVLGEQEGNRTLYRLNNGGLLRLLELLARGREETASDPEREVWQTCPCPRCTRWREQERTAHRQMINRTWERRDEIEPSTAKRERLLALDIYKLLPGGNCKECGEPTCFVFANKLVAGQVRIEQCIPLFSDEQREKREQLLAMLEAAA